MVLPSGSGSHLFNWDVSDYRALRTILGWAIIGSVVSTEVRVSFEWRDRNRTMVNLWAETEDYLVRGSVRHVGSLILWF